MRLTFIDLTQHMQMQNWLIYNAGEDQQMRTARFALAAALIPTVLFSIMLIGTGCFFSAAEHPLWAGFLLLMASIPIWIVRALIISEDQSRRLEVQTSAVVVWLLIGLYVLFVTEMLPPFVYRGFQAMLG